MKKVININFQGRVIPIEETAYDILKQYVESLRRYFANEDGRDEIINDIESRIAELFSERLKKGATCITDEDVQSVIAGMGRPEDFDAENAEPTTAGSTQPGTGASQQSQSTGSTYSSTGPGRGRLYRNADDKIIAGVCSGLANYFHIDPVIMRIVFAVLLFTGGSGLLIYLILWIVVPSQSIQSNITKRLYRSADDKVIAGVCGGLAAYFNISTWVPRLIFALPFIIGLLSGTFNWWWDDWDFWWGPKIVTGSMGSTLFITYIILWIAVPIAVTAAEKLEMRGEKVDLNSIRNTVKEDLEGFKSRAQNWGNEVKQTAQDLGQRARDLGQSEQVKTFSTEAAYTARSAGRGVGHVIGVLFKAFFLFLMGIIALALFGVLMGFLFGGFALFPLKDFVLDGFWQNMLAWLTLILFLGVPLVALITWLIRRIMGVRSRNHYLGYVFGTLWFIGIVSAALLVGSVFRNFKRGSALEENISITQPSGGKLYMDVSNENVHYKYYGNDWFDMDWDEDWPFYGANQDTIRLNAVRINVAKSDDSAFHVVQVKFSRGNTPTDAQSLAQKINFQMTQRDSLLILPKGFAISQTEKFRNQQVMVVVEVPVGKRIFLDRSISKYSWFDVRYNNRGGFDFDDEWDRIYGLETGKEYIMTTDGPKKVESLDPEALKRGEYKELPWDHERGYYKKEPEPASPTDSTGGYRYRNQGNDNKKDTPATKPNTSVYKKEADKTTEVTASSGSTAMSASLTSIMQYFL
jgi:phage shock protein PspC (stress-responsive transcriptional regulator)